LDKFKRAVQKMCCVIQASTAQTSVADCSACLCVGCRCRVWVRSVAWYRFTTQTYPISSIAFGSHSFFTSGMNILTYYSQYTSISLRLLYELLAPGSFRGGARHYIYIYTLLAEDGGPLFKFYARHDE